jgi:hypothetical protein
VCGTATRELPFFQRGKDHGMSNHCGRAAAATDALNVCSYLNYERQLSPLARRSR